MLFFHGGYHPHSHAAVIASWNPLLIDLGGSGSAKSGQESAKRGQERPKIRPRLVKTGQANTVFDIQVNNCGDDDDDDDDDDDVGSVLQSLPKGPPSKASQIASGGSRWAS